MTGARTSRAVRAATAEELVGRPAAQVVAVDRAVVLVAAGDSTALVSGDADDGPVVLVGLDPATGRQQWARPDLGGEGVVAAGTRGEDHLVVARTRDDEARVVALDARTGEVRWRADPIGIRYQVTSIGPATIVLDTSDGPVLLDTRTGRLRAEQPPEGTGSCARWVRGDLDVACAWRNPTGEGVERLLTSGPEADLALSPAAVPTAGLRPLTPRRAFDGLVAFDTIGEGPTVVVDRAGTIARDNAPGELLDLTSSYLVVQEGDDLEGPQRITVLRRR